MHYLWWYVPHLTSPMLIAIIAVIHVLVSHYAVGGGLFLAVETTYARRNKNHEYLAYLKGHARFFVLLTVVLGAVTGVGIWWTIGLASPLATHVLIRTFVFAWAVEYVFFVAELVSAFVFYYYWDKLPQHVHLAAVWLYGIAAWASLVIITAITGFMLDPGKWLQNHDFWTAVLNPQALPQIIARTGGSLLLSSLYIYLHASLVIKEPKLHGLIESRSTKPALLGAVMIAAGGVYWYLMLPESARAAMYAAPVLNVLMALLFVATGVVFALLYVGPFRNPGWIATPGFAASLLVLGVLGFSTGEFIREAVRKPYVVYNVVLGSQMFPSEVAKIREHGYLDSGTFTKAFVEQNYPQLMTGGHVDRQKLGELARESESSKPARLALGGLIFQYHCNDCHAVDKGYSAVAPLMQGWTSEMIRNELRHLHHTRFTMPQWAGLPEEADLLAEYLISIAPPRPKGMLPEAP